MEFLIIGRGAQGGATYESDQIEPIVQGIQQFKEDPRTKAFYGFAGEWAGCLICEVASAQELDEYLSLNPLSTFNDWQVHPLTTADEMLRTVRMIEKHIKSAGRAA